MSGNFAARSTAETYAAAKNSVGTGGGALLVLLYPVLLGGLGSRDSVSGGLEGFFDVHRLLAQDLLRGRNRARGNLHRRGLDLRIRRNSEGERLEGGGKILERLLQLGRWFEVDRVGGVRLGFGRWLVRRLLRPRRGSGGESHHENEEQCNTFHLSDQRLVQNRRKLRGRIESVGA